MRYITLFVTLLSLSSSVLAGSFPLKPYEATYQVAWRSINVGRSIHVLNEIKGKGYQFSSRTQPFIPFIPYEFNEVSQFSWNEATLLPLRYEFYNKEGSKKSQGCYLFDYTSKKITDEEAPSWSAPLSEPIYDQATQALMLRLDLIQNALPKQYTVINKQEIKRWLFTKIREETLETALGPIETVLVETTNGDRTTQLWLAKHMDYLLVHLIQQRKGKTQIEAKLVDAKRL